MRVPRLAKEKKPRATRLAGRNAKDVGSPPSPPEHPPPTISPCSPEQSELPRQVGQPHRHRHQAVLSPPRPVGREAIATPERSWADARQRSLNSVLALETGLNSLSVGQWNRRPIQPRRARLLARVEGVSRVSVLQLELRDKASYSGFMGPRHEDVAR